MQRIQPKKPEKERKVSFISKDAKRCPVCDTSFHREELFSGRVNADELTDELHRTYKPTKAFGEVYPLAYDLEVCPSCFYAAFKQDFEPMGAKAAGELVAGIQDRLEKVQRVFGPLDYQEPRGLVEGAASYYLALMCYEFASKEFAPAFKRGLCALRCAWLCGELDAKHPGDNWDYVAAILHRKARYFYKLALELEESGAEPYSTQNFLGPDTDKNYGFDGSRYLTAVLELKYGPRQDPARRQAALEKAKISVARMFGLGKKTKSKPGPLLEVAHELYEKLKAELHQDSDDD